MNKKIYAGMIAFGIAASFWACGSGEIINPSENDLTMRDIAKLPDGEVIAAFDAILDLQCPECKIPSTPSSSSKTTNKRSSSSTTPVNRSSSSSIVIYTSSSDGTGPSYSSSSSQSGPVPVNSSSSSAIIVGPGSEAGTCGPKEPVVNSGDSVTWVFNNEPTTFPNGWILRSTFIWTTSDGLPASDTVSNYNGINHKVYYSASGKHKALLHIDVNNSSYDLTCTPVQVNGAPITGCKCAPVGVTGSVNYLKTPDVAWTVTGCSTGTGLTLSYLWDGGAASAEASYTKTFSEAATAAAPTLIVANNDNTEVQVNCTPVKVTEGEEFTIKTTTDKVVFAESGSFAISANLPNGWHNSDTECNVYCQAKTSDFTVTIDEIVLSGKVSGQNYVTKGGMPVAHTVGGYTIPVTVEVAAGDSVTCGVNW